VKKLIIINGTMGTGKTTICKILYKKLNNSVWLDGDWCWMMNPFKVTEENKRMAEDNITYLLNNFLENPDFEYVIFSWVMHNENIFDVLLEKLQKNEFQRYKISLVCSPEELKKRMLKDGREEKDIEMSLGRLKSYERMNTIKVDTTNTAVEKTVNEIVNIVDR